MTGWECPKCGQVYSPFVNECGNCRPRTVAAIGTGITYGCTCGTTLPCRLHSSHTVVQGTDGLGNTFRMCAVFLMLALVPSRLFAQQHPDHTAVVAAVKAELVARGVDLSSPGDTKPCNVFAITKRVAWQLRAEGIGYVKKGGNNCDGFSTDALMYRDGTVIDTLVGSGETNGPAWNVVGTRPLSDWAAPVDPGDGNTSGPPPPPLPPPAPSVDLAPLLARLEALERAAHDTANTIDALRQEVGAVETTMNAVDGRIRTLEARPIVTGCRATAPWFALHCELTR